MSNFLKHILQKEQLRNATARLTLATSRYLFPKAVCNLAKSLQLLRAGNEYRIEQSQIRMSII